MKVLVTGANGFLGYFLVKHLLDKDIEVIATSKGTSRLPFEGVKHFSFVTMDFNDPYNVHDVFEKYKPEFIVHAGAMSKPDDCEKDQWQCYLTNVEGTLNLLANAEEYKSFFLFVSTDFVFDGEKGMYDENDTVSPVNFYGKTKLEAEESVMAYSEGWSIVRTVLVYGKPMSGRQNIISIVKNKLENGELYSVVNDQVRTPTYVEDLASAIISIIEKKAEGIFHVSGSEILTPFDMAYRTAEYLGLNKELIKPVASTELMQPAKRPLKTGFIIDKAKTVLGYNPISFEEGLIKTFSNDK